MFPCIPLNQNEGLVNRIIETRHANRHPVRGQEDSGEGEQNPAFTLPFDGQVSKPSPMNRASMRENIESPTASSQRADISDRGSTAIPLE